MKTKSTVQNLSVSEQVKKKKKAWLQKPQRVKLYLGKNPVLRRQNKHIEKEDVNL